MPFQKKDFIRQIKVRMFSFNFLNPDFYSYNNTEHYIQFLFKKKKPIHLNFHENKNSFCLFYEKHKFGINIITPIHFQNEIGNNFFEKNLTKLFNFFKENEVLCFYIQTREYIKFNSELINNERFRSCYYLNLNQEMEEYLNSTNNLTKRLLKKNNLEKYKLIKTNRFDNFIKNYLKLSKEKNFSYNYCYKEIEWYKLLDSKLIEYYELSDNNNNFLFGGVFGIQKNEIDYLYGCGSDVNNSASRIFFFKIFENFKSRKFSKIFLGGGVKENDSLSKFKISIGGIKQICTTIRGVTNKSKYLDLYKSDIGIFDNFFPPRTI